MSNTDLFSANTRDSISPDGPFSRSPGSLCKIDWIKSNCARRLQNDKYYALLILLYIVRS